jgi:hypothetical protein
MVGRLGHELHAFKALKGPGECDGQRHSVIGWLTNAFTSGTLSFVGWPSRPRELYLIGPLANAMANGSQ